MPGQPEQPEVPADPDRAWPELRPAFVVDVRDVLQFEPCAAVGLGREPQLDPRHFAAELPRRADAVRRGAALDRAAGVAFELVAPALAQIARDRQKPAWDALRVGARVPDVLDPSIVRSDDGDRARLTGLQHTRADLTLDGVDLVDDIDHGFGVLPSWVCWRSRRSRRPRASSVSSASRCGVQKRRKRSSQASTSRSPAGLTE